MIRRQKTVDRKVFDLAKLFLDDGDLPYRESDALDLSQNIQQAIEDWFEAEANKRKAPDVLF